MRYFLVFFFILVCTLSFSQSKLLKATLIKVYDFEKTENFTAAKEVLQPLKNHPQLSDSERNFISSYLLLYDFILSDYKDIEKVNIALKTMANKEKREKFETQLLLYLYTHKYMYVASSKGWDESLEIAEEGIKIKDFKQAKLETQTDYLYDLAFLYDRTKNYFESISYYKKSLELYIAQFGENSTYTALTYNNLAFTYSNAYDTRNTISYYLKAANAWEKIHSKEIDKKDYLITVYQNLEFEYLSYGDLEKANWALSKFNFHYLKKYNNIEGQKLSTFISAKLSYVLCNVSILARSGKLEEAERMIRNLNAEKKIDYNNPEHLQYLYDNYMEIITYCMDQKKYKEVIKYGERLNVLLKKHPLKSFLVSCNFNLSLAYRNLKMPNKAFFYIEEAIKDNNYEKFNSTKYTTQLLKSKILGDLSKDYEAAALVKSNLENLVFELNKVKKTLVNIRFNDVKDLVSTDFINLFYKSGEVYLKQYDKLKNKNDLEIAFNLYKISSKLFKEYYLKGEYNETLNFYQNEINDGLLEIALKKKLGYNEKINLINAIEQNASQHLIMTYQNKIHFNTNENNKLVKKLNELNSELNFYKNRKSDNQEKIDFNKNKITTIESQIAEISKKTSKTEQNINKISASNFDLKEVLDRITTNEAIFKYYVTQQNVYCLVLEKDKIEIKKIGTKKEILELVTDFTNAQKNLESDYKEKSNALSVLIPQNKLKNKISIVPDNFLNFIPFESIYDTTSTTFLVQNHILSYEYSLPVWLLNKKYNYRTGNESSKLVAFSPSYKNKEVAQKRGELKNLLYAEKEAYAIAKLFNGTSYLNQVATKANFIKEIENFDIFHLSMHSQLFEDDFNKSCLVFSNEEKLYFSDLYGMNIPASMVVLSACDTGNGTLKNGEGIMSMSRALTYAGVKSAVVSLWQVPDKETSEIMISFYENLKKGQAKDEALANAKNSFIKKNPMKNHPFYWAGFIINGDVSPIKTANYTIWILGFAIITALGLFFFFWKKRK